MKRLWDYCSPITAWISTPGSISRSATLRQRLEAQHESVVRGFEASGTAAVDQRGRAVVRQRPAAHRILDYRPRGDDPQSLVEYGNALCQRSADPGGVFEPALYCSTAEIPDRTHHCPPTSCLSGRAHPVTARSSDQPERLRLSGCRHGDYPT